MDIEDVFVGDIVTEDVDEVRNVVDGNDEDDVVGFEMLSLSEGSVPKMIPIITPDTTIIPTNIQKSFKVFLDFPFPDMTQAGQQNILTLLVTTTEPSSTPRLTSGPSLIPRDSGTFETVTELFAVISI